MCKLIERACLGASSQGREAADAALWHAGSLQQSDPWDTASRPCCIPVVPCSHTTPGSLCSSIDLGEWGAAFACPPLWDRLQNDGPRRKVPYGALPLALTCRLVPTLMAKALVLFTGK